MVHVMKKLGLVGQKKLFEYIFLWFGCFSQDVLCIHLDKGGLF